MFVAGIIAEYNPFHKGHAYHIQKTREMGATHIVAVLGGDFTQRGDIALLSKHARAEAAVRCGADLVLELPCLWSMSTAGNFALGGVSVLKSLGVVDALSFGSERGEIAPLEAAADAAADSGLKPALDRFLAQGMTFAAARQAAIAEQYGAVTAALFSEPNNTLGMEYIAAARRLSVDLRFFTVRRKGAAHDTLTKSAFLSAAAIRAKVAAGADPSASLPEPSAALLSEAVRAGETASLRRLETAILCKLKMMDKAVFAHLPDRSEGIENRLFSAVREAGTLDALCAAVKTKRYPMARVRRLILSAFLGLDDRFWLREVPYLRPLAFGPGGREILRAAREAAQKPIVYSVADGMRLGGDVAAALSYEIKTADLFNMATAAKRCEKNAYTTPIFKSMEETTWE